MPGDRTVGGRRDKRGAEWPDRKAREMHGRCEEYTVLPEWYIDFVTFSKFWFLKNPIWKNKIFKNIWFMVFYCFSLFFVLNRHAAGLLENLMISMGIPSGNGVVENRFAGTATWKRHPNFVDIQHGLTIYVQHWLIQPPDRSNSVRKTRFLSNWPTHIRRKPLRSFEKRYKDPNKL